MNQRGGSLPEALIALVVLSASMLTVMLLAIHGNALIREDLAARATLRVTANAAELATLRPRITPDLHALLEAEQRDEQP